MSALSGAPRRCVASASVSVTSSTTAGFMRLREPPLQRLAVPSSNRVGDEREDDIPREADTGEEDGLLALGQPAERVQHRRRPEEPYVGEGAEVLRTRALEGVSRAPFAHDGVRRVKGRQVDERL